MNALISASACQWGDMEIPFIQAMRAVKTPAPFVSKVKMCFIDDLPGV
jgi:hypothetical protein